MNISRPEHIVVVDDGTAAHYGVGVLVPAVVVCIFIVIVWPPAASRLRFDLGALAFVATALALAALKPPRTAEFDLDRREVRLTVGWPPILGRRKIIPFDTIREAKVWQLVRLDDDLGYSRPALVLGSGKTVFLSTYNRSPKRCREIIEQVRPLLGAQRC